MPAKGSRRGRLLAIGGAEDSDEECMRILPHLVEMAGGRRARILICASSSAEPADTVREYSRLLRKAGAAEVDEAAVTERHEADEPKLLERLNRATALFFTGGDQLRLTTLIGGTQFAERLFERFRRDGLVIAGTSAGAAAMGSTMIIGNGDGASVRRADVRLQPGLGLWQDVVIDTHFNERGRVHRILTIFASNPQVLGIGLDENTAIEIVPQRRFTVVGEGAAMVLDGRVTHSSSPDRADQETLALTDSVVHVLTEGYGFDLQTLRPLLPTGKEIEK